MDEFPPIAPLYPPNVIPITSWWFYAIKKYERQIQEACGLTPEMIRAMDRESNG